MFLKSDILSHEILSRSLTTHEGFLRLAKEKFHNLSLRNFDVLPMNYQLVLNQNSIKIKDLHGKQVAIHSCLACRTKIPF